MDEIECVNMDKLKRPHYHWTYSQHIPLRVFYNGENARILLTSGIGTHNACWLHLLKPNDILVCNIPYCANKSMFQLDMMCLRYFDINPNRIYVLGNTEQQVQDARELGMNAELINQNAFLDYNLFSVGDKDRVYNAVYCARPIPLKNHKLCVRLNNMALVLGYHQHKVDMSYLDYSYINTTFLPIQDVVGIYQQSKVGLMLSVDEGACYSSSEYLLCGLPVVSARSEGGRNIWYDNYNSRICDLTEDSIANSVQFFLDNPVDSNIIRENHIKLMKIFRSKFVNFMDSILAKYDENIDALSIFKEKFEHKYVEYYIDPHLAFEILTGKQPKNKGIVCLKEEV